MGGDEFASGFSLSHHTASAHSATIPASSLVKAAATCSCEGLRNGCFARLHVFCQKLRDFFKLRCVFGIDPAQYVMSLLASASQFILIRMTWLMHADFSSFRSNGLPIFH